MDIAAEAEHQCFVRDLGAKQGFDFLESGQPCGGVNFKNQSFGITIQDQPGPAVALTIDDAITIGFVVEQVLSDIQGSGEKGLPEGGIDILGFS